MRSVETFTSNQLNNVLIVANIPFCWLRIANIAIVSVTAFWSQSVLLMSSGIWWDLVRRHWLAMPGFCCGSLPDRWGLVVMRFQAGSIVASTVWSYIGGHVFDVMGCYNRVCHVAIYFVYTKIAHTSPLLDYYGLFTTRMMHPLRPCSPKGATQLWAAVGEKAVGGWPQETGKISGAKGEGEKWQRQRHER